MMLFAALAAVTAPTAAPCTTLCDPDRLRPVFAKLRAAKRDHQLVRILQIGDSHTAGDQVTGSWRALLQQRFGFGGRGVLPPGRPYQGYLTRGVTVSTLGAWSYAGIFGPNYRGEAGGTIGLTGYTATAGDGGTMTLAADGAAYGFDRVTVCGLVKNGAGSVTIAAGMDTALLPLAAEGGANGSMHSDGGVACRRLDLPSPTMRVTLGVVGGPVTLTSWATEAATRGGVTLSNLGTVGAQLVHWTTRTDDRAVAAELAQYHPDLLVVAFGTNEAFMPAFSASGFRTRLRAGIERIRRLAPGVPILLVGAPDSTTRLTALQVGEGGASAPCPAAAAPLPTTDAPGPAPAASGPIPTAALSVVQAIQRETAHAMGLAYWDWSARMGGRCIANAFAASNPPWMRGDHVHFTTVGAAEVARRLEADWEGAMAADAAASATDPAG